MQTKDMQSWFSQINYAIKKINTSLPKMKAYITISEIQKTLTLRIYFTVFYFVGMRASVMYNRGQKQMLHKL